VGGCSHNLVIPSEDGNHNDQQRHNRLRLSICCSDLCVQISDSVVTFLVASYKRAINSYCDTDKQPHPKQITNTSACQAFFKK
jgi:hypothetical protein